VRASLARLAPESGAHRQLLLPRLGPNQTQVRDVAAGDEQDYPDGGEQNPEGLTDGADRVLSERPNVRLQR
jgi:hypothetical protein